MHSPLPLPLLRLASACCAAHANTLHLCITESICQRLNMISIHAVVVQLDSVLERSIGSERGEETGVWRPTWPKYYNAMMAHAASELALPLGTAREHAAGTVQLLSSVQ